MSWILGLTGIRGFNFKSDGLSGKCLHKDLHFSSKAEYKVKGGLLLDAVVRESAAIFKLFARQVNKTLLIG